MQFYRDSVSSIISRDPRSEQVHRMGEFNENFNKLNNVLHENRLKNILFDVLSNVTWMHRRTDIM